MKKIILVVIPVLLSGCLSDHDIHNENSARVIGMPNPASVYCNKIGGETEIVKTSLGQTGYCRLPSGERMEEWELFRRDHQ